MRKFKQINTKIITGIFLTLLIGMILTILPLPKWTTWFHPSWILMTLIFWLIYFPAYSSLSIFWLIGLFVDLLTGTVLGQHSLIFVLVGYLFIRFLSNFSNLPLWQQSLVWIPCSLIIIIVQHSILMMVAESEGSFWYLLPILNAVLWPPIFSLLRKYYVVETEK